MDRWKTGDRFARRLGGPLLVINAGFGRRLFETHRSRRFNSVRCRSPRLIAALLASERGSGGSRAVSISRPRQDQFKKVYWIASARASIRIAPTSIYFATRAPFTAIAMASRGDLLGAAKAPESSGPEPKLRELRSCQTNYPHRIGKSASLPGEKLTLATCRLRRDRKRAGGF